MSFKKNIIFLLSFAAASSVARASDGFKLLELLQDPALKGIIEKIMSRRFTPQEADALKIQSQATAEKSKADSKAFDATIEKFKFDQERERTTRQEEQHKQQLIEMQVRDRYERERTEARIKLEIDRDKKNAKNTDELTRLREADARREEAKAHTERMKRETDSAREKEKARSDADIATEKAKNEERYKNAQDPKRRKIDHDLAQEQSAIRTAENRAAITTKVQEFKKAFFEFTDNTERLIRTGKFFVFTVGGCAAAIYILKYGLPIVRKMIEEKLFTPHLIEESSQTSCFNTKQSKKDVPTLKDLHFDVASKQKVDEIVVTLENTKKIDGYYMNYLFYGPPGTGKTATARAVAYESGMDFAFMTGGSVLDLLRSGKGVARLKEVFDWAEKSPRGLILFIDEADAFLGDPNGDMSEELNAMLKAFLNYTGTESKKFCLILSTNHPNKLAKAVQSRIGYGDRVLFGLPNAEARLAMVNQFIQKYLGNINTGSYLNNNQIATYIAEKTEGFSGRSLSYLVLGIQKAALATNQSVTKTLVERVVEDAVSNYKMSEADGFVSYA